MNCSNCGNNLAEGVNFCSNCGLNVNNGKPAEKKQIKISPEVVYGHYLPIGGWISIIAGVIVAIYTFSKANTGYNRLDSGVVITGLVIFISSVIYALLYFGLHKAILKINRIEEALGIANYQDTQGPNRVDDIKKSSSESAGNVRKKDVNDSDDLPWELRENN